MEHGRCGAKSPIFEKVSTLTGVAGVEVGDREVGDAQQQVERVVAGEAHWQLGHAERAGQYLEHIMVKLLEDVCPTTAEEWDECLL